MNTSDPTPFPLKPYKSPIPYTLVFFGMGTANGLIWTVTLEKILQPRTAHIIIWSMAAVLFIGQSISLFIEERRFKRWEAEFQKWMDENGNPMAKL